MSDYNFSEIEKKWQKIWAENNAGLVSKNPELQSAKSYVLNMFPYPSASGLHVGHVLGWSASDVLSRYLRAQGQHVLFPIGFDAFGLPAENFAIKTKTHPKITTESAIITYTKQMKSLGLSTDWSGCVSTADPEYYKWTQWLFLQLHKQGLAYKKKSPVNWCESCQTVLAREQVIDGKCERCKNIVIQKDLDQWFFKITAYAEELLADLEKLDWPSHIKELQKNWIGKSVGAYINFDIVNTAGEKLETIKVFTTRPDTLFGVTYIVASPESQLLQNHQNQITNLPEVKNYQEQARQKSELERSSLQKEKTGVEVKGLYAINPATGEQVPLWSADYVIASYGSGIVMAVPAHDERDYEFAKKYNLPFKYVILPSDVYWKNNIFEERDALQKWAYNTSSQTPEDEESWDSKLKEGYKKFVANYSEGKVSMPFVDDGQSINSAEFSGLTTTEAKEKIIAWLETNDYGQKAITYKMRDWLISRQRYWGAPIPMIYCPDCGLVPEAENILPVLLPEDVDFLPTGESPLLKSKTFHQVTCPRCGETEKVRREVDTMDTFVDSSWYFVRYADAHNSKKFADPDKIKYWLPVDNYLGGAEHAVMHLLYARFFTKALADAKLLNFREPFLKFRANGMIYGEDGQKMSKSIGNVVNPDEVIAKYGADTLRLYVLFMGPFEDNKPWSSQSIAGISRFLDRVWKMNDKNLATGTELRTLVHQTIKKISHDLPGLGFNTCISQLMILLNDFDQNPANKNEWQVFLQLLSPFAPHLTSEIAEKLNFKLDNSWPKFDEAKLLTDEVTISIQINGKFRGTVTAKRDTSASEIIAQIKLDEKINKFLTTEIKKEILIANKLLSLIV